MESKIISLMDTSTTITLLLFTLFFMATRSAAVQSIVAQSVSKSNELQKCENGLGATCGNTIYQHVFERGNEVSKECCSRLITVGKDCHDLLTEVTIVYKRTPEKKAKEIWHKNDKAWEDCKQSAAPSPKGSSELQNCENGLGAKCGHLIYQHVFKSKKEVSKECCRRLLSIGKDCHDLLTEVTIVYKRLTEKHAKEIWHRNDKVWEECEKD
ncbi:hypothetical protein RND81_12G059400 [Saponaria officinalis]|uniref:Prolamin-like domain-containing protein n=1 Tax=Saponaria officinalis TaxID=3572 RepID=A0AAW1H7B0_SAPOF